MAITTLARRIFKAIFFILLTLIVGRSLGDPEVYVNYDVAKALAQFISGDVNAESLYDVYFYIDFFSVMAITTTIYILSVKLIKKIRSK